MNFLSWFGGIRFVRDVSIALSSDTASRCRVTNVVVSTNALQKGGDNQSRQMDSTDTAKQWFVVGGANQFDVLVAMYRSSQ